MKLKSFCIVISSLITLVSISCIVIEYIKLKQTQSYYWKTNRNAWEADFLSASRTWNAQLQDLDFRKNIDVIDLKLKKIQIFGRLKAGDDLKLQQNLNDIQDKRDDVILSEEYGEITGSMRPVDTSKLTFMDKSLTHKNQHLPEEKKQADFAPQALPIEGTKSGRNVVEETKIQTSNHPFKKNNINFGTGFLNLHIWDNICNYNLESLKEYILFPALPTFRKVVNTTDIHNLNVTNSGVRIFGFLKPNETGKYRFGISSSGNSELWLSNDTNVLNKTRIAFVGTRNELGLSEESVYDHLSTQTSQELHLVKGYRYFIEILYKYTKGTGRVQVAWTTPCSNIFKVIPGTFLSSFIDDNHVTQDEAEIYDKIDVQMSTNGFSKMTFMDFIDFEKAFPFCDYEPSYYVTKKLVRFQGARNKSNTHFPEVYPPDGTDETLPLVKGEDIWWTENNYGNDVIDNATVEHVERVFTDTFENIYKDDFRVVKMMSMERVVDKVKGSRYHIQMTVEDVYSGRYHEFSEFLFQPKGSGSLCFPRDFRWSKHADVNIIVPIKNSGRWALYFIKNVAAIINKTLDPRIRLIIVDYSNTDIDIEAVLKHITIIRHTIVRMPSDKAFNRAEALQRGADAVKDPNSILFMCDLHLIMPVTLIETIRKHCVEGKMAFAPVVKRLKCGYYPSKPVGYWETLGFGLFALYKSDFDRVGGMNVNEFKGWGGEDWELLDRVLESRIEVERLKISSFFHCFHPAYGNERSRVNAK